MIDYQQFGAVAARDRTFSSSNYVPNALDRTGLTSFPANVLVPVGLPNPTGDPASEYRNPACAPPMSFPTPEKPYQCNFDPAYLLNIVNASERLAATSALTWQLGSGHEFYFQGLYTRNSLTYVAAPTPFQNNPATPSRNFILPAASPWYPHAFASSFGIDGSPLNCELAVGRARGSDVGARAGAMEHGRRHERRACRMALRHGIQLWREQHRRPLHKGLCLWHEDLPDSDSGRVDPYSFK